MNKLLERIYGLLARASLSAKDGSRPMRVIQATLLDEDVRENIEHFEPYGFTSEPHIGSEPLIASLGGDRDHSIAFVVADRRYRLKNLRSGEVAIFDDLGRKVYLKRDQVLVEAVDAPVMIHTTSSLTADVGSVATIKAGSKIVLDTPTVECTGNVRATGDITDKNGSGGISMASMRSTYNSHTHVHGDSSSNPPTQSM